MKREILKPSGVSDEVLADYQFFSNVRDDIGRTWKLAAYPRHGGSIAYFRDLSSMRAWVRQVEDIRAAWRGEPSLKMRIVEAAITEQSEALWTAASRI